MNNKHEASRDKIVEEAYREEDIQNLEQREWETVIKSSTRYRLQSQVQTFYLRLLDPRDC